MPRRGRGTQPDDVYEFWGQAAYWKTLPARGAGKVHAVLRGGKRTYCGRTLVKGQGRYVAGGYTCRQCGRVQIAALRQKYNWL
jgi:hypothetical protein